jgi:hypothetical protein
MNHYPEKKYYKNKNKSTSIIYFHIVEFLNVESCGIIPR